MHIKKGDKVVVISGDDKGKTGTVARAIPSEGKVLVEGVNVKKKTIKPRQQGKQGQIVEIAYPIRVENVMLVDGKTGKPTRVGFKEIGGKKVRVSIKSGAAI